MDAIIVTNASAKEIAALVLAVQERQAVGIEVKSPTGTIAQAVRRAIGGTAEA